VISSRNILKESILAFINDDALSRGAAISFYTATSMAPVLLIVIAVAGLAVGRDAAQNGVTAHFDSALYAEWPRSPGRFRPFIFLAAGMPQRWGSGS
jgi:hypothetical protein